MQPREHPTWDDTIQALFAAPYWIEADRQATVAADWKGCMDGFDVHLDQYASVRQWAVTIYDHLHSRNMPLTLDRTQFWPDEALEALRTWVNEGWRKDSAEPIVDREVIPRPMPRPAPMRLRRDILDLSEAELDEYRWRLEEVGVSSVDPASTWQRTAYIHTNWCLHYQEAFLLWHRASLLYFENILGFPIPYWNWMAVNATKDGSPEAGLPKPFRDLTYIHPRTGEERPNPLRFGAAKDGRSKACTMPGWPPLSPEQCRWVQRDPILYTEGDDHRAEREKKLSELSITQAQVVNALQWPVFSSPEGSPGYPWANIQTFPAPDSAYPHRCDFDGLYEQPHDNIHGWVGPDMADNAYTAFDPVFWSHHSNIDRIFEQWKRANPAAQYTAPFPIRPFVGAQAQDVDFDDPRDYLYTTLGDLAKDSRSLGYDYAPSKHPEVTASAYQARANHLYVVFGDVRCTYDTYTVDIFLNQPDPAPADADLANPHYAGRVTRLGMGVEDERGRCVAVGVSRVHDASRAADALGLAPGSEVAVSLVVTDVTRASTLTPEEYRGLPGFAPSAEWGPALTTVVAAAAAPAAHAARADGGPACHT